MANDKEQWWTDNHSDEESLSEAFADAAAEKVKQDAELEQAKTQLNQTKDKETSTEKIKAQETLNKAKAWFQASKSN